MLTHFRYLKRKVKFYLKNILGKKNSIVETAFFHIKPNYSILEAGAHVGVDTVKLSRLTTSKIYAFEPIPELYIKLVQATKDLNNVNTFEIALSNQSSDVDFFLSSGESDASSSILKPAQHLNTNPDVKFERNIKVKGLSLDDWAFENNVKKIDFMWLDMQGYEFEMLKSSNKIFPTVKVLYTEVSTIELYENQAIYSDFKKWLQDHGFKLIVEDLEWGFTGNALFIRND